MYMQRMPLSSLLKLICGPDTSKAAGSSCRPGNGGCIRRSAVPVSLLPSLRWLLHLAPPHAVRLCHAWGQEGTAPGELCCLQSCRTQLAEIHAPAHSGKTGQCPLCMSDCMAPVQNVLTVAATQSAQASRFILSESNPTIISKVKIWRKCVGYWCALSSSSSCSVSHLLPMRISLHELVAA